ncbi:MULTISPECIES: PAAR domain-containing protein [Variovorax]|uniref:PAAR domain-containing protein n=1 Tax=Variovorax TaxID=34072 RepID=UPI001AD15B48|nr:MULTISPECIES: PAAR domain-containing protein [Variovorax]MBN8751759.1 PAAR domain-containing protein [Variovorax sp.]
MRSTPTALRWTVRRTSGSPPVGDSAVCVGPPDVIVQGSATVLIGGRSAARMGDATAHGGSIVLGLPTVMIGG